MAVAYTLCLRHYYVMSGHIFGRFYLCVLIVIGLSGSAVAETLKSNNYAVDESFIGGGGMIEEGSANYKALNSIGNVGVGESSSTSFTTESGYTTTNDPTLSFVINAGVIDFGALSTIATSTATSTFSVLNYTSHGYIVQTIGSPPSNGSYTLSGMGTTAASQVGVEQYGMNVVANTSPTTFGANPTGGYGVASANYGAANQYRYVPGEVIASAPKSSGTTDFTISYIVNASNNTPGGTYTGKQTLVCTGTY